MPNNNSNCFLSTNLDTHKNWLLEQYGEEVFQFIKENIENDAIIHLLSTNSIELVKQLDHKPINGLINLEILNKAQFINKFLETINSQLEVGQYFIGCAENYAERYHNLKKKFPPLLNSFIISLDFVYSRVFPKIKYLRSFYYFGSRTKLRVMSMAEILGRLISCGYKIVCHNKINGLIYFKVIKVKEPEFNMHPSYSIVFKMNRIGKNGKSIKLYKFRTMHPYSEYLQEYIYQTNQLKEGGKINNDFRISAWGHFMRKYWIDELPQLWNLMKGDINLVGVRPLSKHYLSLYPDEVKELRLKYKPGLIPPYYADMPKTFEEIINSEKKYLLLKEKKPFLTDFIYFYKALKNIIFRNARSS